MGIAHIYFNWHVRSVVQTTILNLGWTIYNMLILGASVAAASERRQIRAMHRVAMQMPVMLKFSTGRTLACETIDYSEGGVGVALPAAIQVPMHERVTVSLFRGDEEYAFPATVGFTAPGRVGLRFSTMTREQEYEFVKTTFARADAWTGWSEGRAAGHAAARPVACADGRRARHRGAVRASLRRPSQFDEKPSNGRQEAKNQRLIYGQLDGEGQHRTLESRAQWDRIADAPRGSPRLATADARPRVLARFADGAGRAAGVGG